MDCCPLCGGDIKRIYPKLSVSKCRSCRLVFRNPQPTGKELSRIYSEDYTLDNITKGVTGQASSTISLANQYATNISKEFGTSFDRKMVLDFGTGLGTIAMELKKRGANVVAVEPVKNARLVCEKRGIRSFPRVGMVPLLLKFDLAVAVEVVEHLRKPWETLTHIFNRLKDNGCLYVSTPNIKGLNAQISRSHWREILKSTHLYFFEPKTLERILKSSGFKNIKRLKWIIKYTDSPIRRFLHLGLQYLRLDGSLRYFAKKQ